MKSVERGVPPHATYGARTGHVAGNLATPRRTVPNLPACGKDGKGGIKGNQPNASRDHGYPLRLLDFHMCRPRVSAGAGK